MEIDNNIVKDEATMKTGLNMNMCRLCLSEENTNLEPVYFNDNSPDEVLLQKIYELTTIQVEYANDFPSAICEACKSKLDDYDRFRNQCLENNEILKMKYFELKAAETYQVQNDVKSEEYPEESEEITLAIDDNANLEQYEGTQETYQFEKNESSQTGEVEGHSVHYIVEHSNEYEGNVQGGEIREEVIQVNEYNATGEIQTVNNGLYYTTDGTYEIEADEGYSNAENYPQEEYESQPEMEYAQLENINQNGLFQEENITSGTPVNTLLIRGVHDRPYVCKHCKTSFKYEYNYQRHMKNHAKTLYKCGKCSKTFTKIKKCQQHFLKAHSTQRYECDICFRTYSLPTRLENHVIEMHSENGVYKCERCPETFTSYLEFKSHRKSHSTVKVTCNCEHCINGNTSAHQEGTRSETCDFEVMIDQTSQSTRIHKPGSDANADSSNSDEDEVIVIEDDESAEKNTLHKQLLMQIEESEANSPGPKIYQCEHCTQLFAQLNNLKAHIYAEHDKNKPFKCKLCPISFKTKEILVMHMVLHSQASSP